MATTTAKRVLVSESKKTVATLEVGDWKLNITYEGPASKPVTQVNVIGNKGSVYFNYSKMETGTNLSFSNEDLDLDLIAAVKAEVDDITKAP